MIDKQAIIQQPTDELVAEGNWDGFQTEQLLTEEGARQLMEHRHLLAKERAMDQVTGTGFLKTQPFRWKDRVYRILRADYLNGEALVEIAPHDDELVAELKKRIEQDRFHSLNVYLGFGFICFPEDYSKYS